MTIEGRLIRLRAIEPSDAQRATVWINDREVTKNLMARYPISLAAEREWAESASKSEYQEVRLAIETLERAHIGFCGLHHGRPEDRHAELGIMIGDKDYWNRGYGTDAMLTLVRFAFDTLNMHKVTLGVFAPNERARAVYRKIGFVEEGRSRDDYFQDGRYWDIVRMSVLEDEFRALHGAAEPSFAAETAQP